MQNLIILAKDLIKTGLKGPEIGKKIKELEKIKFEKLIQQY